MKFNTLWALASVPVLSLAFAGEASASHFRGGYVAWEKVPNTASTVKFKIRHAWRTGAVSSPLFVFGDNTSQYITGTAVATLTDLSGNAYTVIETEVTHTYAAMGNFTAGISTNCCRISNLSNGADGYFSLYANVNISSGQNGSSVMSLPYVLEVDNGPNDIPLAPIDVDGPVSCRWATQQESGILPPPATMTSNCHLQFDGTGKPHGAIYAGQVIMEQGGAKTPYDMMFQVNANIANLAPTCSFAQNGQASNTIPMGQPFSIAVIGTDPEGGTLKVNTLGLPSGASLTPGAGSTGASPMTATFNWTPSVVGQSAVTVLFQDNANQSCQKSFTLDVINPDQPPVANAGADGNVNEGGNYVLNGSLSNDPNNDALTYSWNQLSGPSVALNDSSADMPSFVAPWLSSNQTLTFELTVNAGGKSDTDTVDVTVVANNHPPVADAGDNSTIKEGATKSLNGSNSYDPDNEPVQSYAWTQVAGPVVTLLGANTINASFTADPGLAGQSVTFQLQASDGKEPSILSTLPDSNVAGDDLVTVKIVANSAPVANTGDDQTKNENNTVELNGSLSSDPDSDLITYQWTQKTGTSVSLSDDSAVKPTFTAPWVSAGGEDLEFSLVVTDNDPINPKSSVVDNVLVHVANENDPPSCDKAQPSVAAFWPPNHTMQSVAINNVIDPASTDTVTINITGVTQDESTNGTGDGDTSPDASFNGSDLLLRAERAGNGDGRVYKVSFSATDGKEACTGAIKVTVPHSRKTNAIDSGQSVNSTQP